MNKTIKTDVPAEPDSEQSKVPLPIQKCSDSSRLGTVDTSYFLVGVGASAGGLDAIKAFLAPIPADCPHSFVFIQHISPDYKSMMGELLRRETSLPILEVEDNMPVKAGHCYIIPPKANVIIQGTHPEAKLSPARTKNGITNATQRTSEHGLYFSLVDQPPRPQLNLPIDLFFQSLAEAVGDRSVAVILSGTGSDGSRGLRAIKDAEGIVMVQDPETAPFDGMPRAAIASQLTDFVLQPHDMAGELYRYFELHRTGMIQIERTFKDSQPQFQEILRLVSSEAHIDFSAYKLPTLQRRTIRRMTIKQCMTVNDYLALMKKEPREIAILHREFLVGVTHFFRDYPAWQVLSEQVLPDLVENASDSEPIKIWSVGCSTGEEAYTIAMILDDYLRETGSTRDFKVFASDVNEASISFAKNAAYPESIIEDIPAKYAKKYVTFKHDAACINESIRKKVIFSTHNALDDPPFIYTDLILCRNFLIYLASNLQGKLLTTFSYALKENGYLFLGASESVDRGFSRFKPIDQRWRIFSNSARAATHESRDTNYLRYFAPNFRPSGPRMRDSGTSHPEKGVEQLFSSVMQGIGGCTIVVDDHTNVLETYGNYQDYVRLPEQGFSAKLLDLLPKRLVSALSIVLRKAAKEECASYGPIKMIEGKEPTSLILHCIQFTHVTGTLLYAIVIREVEEALSEPGTTLTSASQNLGEQTNQHIEELETELAVTRETLETTVEDLGVTNEELQTSNEELMSANEELQATNEEMQSVNEELHTINAEHAEKITELEAAYADIENFLKATSIAVVFLDADLRIRRFSDTISSIFKIDARDIGRPLDHFSASFESQANQKILSAAELALSTGTKSTYEVWASDGSWYLVNVHPFKVATGQIDGVVLSFVDITHSKTAQTELQNTKDLLEALIEGETAGYWDWNIPANTEFMSPRFKQMFGYLDHEIENTPDAWKRIIHSDDLPKVVASFDAHVKSRGKVPYDNEVRYFHKDGSIVWVLCRGKVIEWGPQGEAIRMIGCHLDITDLKTRELESIKRSEEIRRFAYICAHDLREPMSTVENFLKILRLEAGEQLQGESAKMLGYIESASVRMRRQIEGILDFAKLQDSETEFKEIDMNELVNGCLADLGRSIELSEAEITLNRLPSVLGMYSLICRVIQNLVSNSMKFRRKDRTAKIVMSGRLKQHGLVEYRISDNGIGIEPGFRDKVFDIFYQLHTKSEYEGSGIGLALCRKIVELHGGTIWIEDGIDGGSAICFTIKSADCERCLTSGVSRRDASDAASQDCKACQNTSATAINE